VPRNIRPQWLQGYAIMCRWGVAKDRTIGEKGLRYSFLCLSWFQAGPFLNKFWLRGF